MVEVRRLPGAIGGPAQLIGLWKTLWEKFHWHANEFGVRRPSLLERLGLPFTVVDVFSTPGDTLLTGIVCRELKKKHPRLRINCMTRNPDLLELDPNIDTVNGPETFFTFQFTYLDLIHAKTASINVLKPSMAKLGIQRYEYRAEVHLNPLELSAGRERLKGLQRPIISINTISREKVKTWPLDYWCKTVEELQGWASLVQLGDGREPEINGALRLAGTLTMRESMSVLAHADLHIGPDSFLMHAANGVNVPAIIIFGGSRPPASLGYPRNVNLAVEIDCAPCWIHDSSGGHCPYGIKCMDMITPETVVQAAKSKLRATSPVNGTV
jgi:ADP-heptose:LPS heptosyltransferase